ncbi:transmembrane protein 183 isoform X2 [Cimex lectularius]|uniref:F-box domain-containing protein n=1 Tax=Cimex lectularius TaxID=79782 RepID=A0A8I6S8J8_CIMLE|nr:transmembrane protein 183 isoform X2 [Cimex lectularius]
MAERRIRSEPDDNRFNDVESTHTREQDDDDPRARAGVIDHHYKHKMYCTKLPLRGLEDFTYSKNLPQEIWYTISGYILPMDVLSFALICKQSYFVLNMPSFWIRLYKRYSLTNARVPPKLKNDILEKTLGLKTNVVKSLFFSYPPFVNRKNKLDTYEKVLGMKCIDSLIHPKCNEESLETFCWVYDFIFEKFKINTAISSKEKYPINYNPDIGKTILRIKADNYCIIKQIFGLHVKKVKYNKLLRSVHIEFGPAYLPTDSNANAVNVYVYTVDEPPGVFEWWHPSYYEEF